MRNFYRRAPVKSPLAVEALPQPGRPAASAVSEIDQLTPFLQPDFGCIRTGAGCIVDRITSASCAYRYWTRPVLYQTIFVGIAGVPLLLAVPRIAGAEAVENVDPIVVTGHYDNGVGTTDAASAGVITPQLIDDRAILRPGEVLEYIPGMIVTQHSGAGKANQYFLRGFNLDHGTDFDTYLAGMPVNMRTHAHGQGYTDLNFLIPELVSRIDYFKGPYNAAEGDFSTAGGANIFYFDRMPKNLAELTGGSDQYGRALLLGSTDANGAAGCLLYAFEAFHDNGPWNVPENFRKYNGMLRYTAPVGDGQFGITAMGYDGRWTATDQIPAARRR